MYMYVYRHIYIKAYMYVYTQMYLKIIFIQNMHLPIILIRSLFVCLG